MGLKFPNPTTTYDNANPSGDLSWAYFDTFPTLTTPTQWGSSTITEVGTLASVAASATVLRGRSYTNTTTVNSVASVVMEAVYCIGTSFQLLTSLALNATTLRRVWFGMSDVVPATMAASATPVANYFAFRYDTGAGDSTWRCLSDNNTGTPTNNVSTGIAPTTTPQNLAMVVNSATSISFFVNNQKLVNLGGTLPATSVVTLRPFISITNLSAGTTRAFTMYFMAGRVKVV
jgi:Tfp pilus assembly major pilin PilA